MLAKCIGASPTISTAGHTGMPVGTDATKRRIRHRGSGSSSDALAATGATRGVDRRREVVRRLDRHVRNRDDSRRRALQRRQRTAGTDVARRDRRATSGPARSSRALSRAMNSGDGSIGGRLRTSSRLRRIAVSCREQREQCVEVPLHRLHLDGGQQIIDECDVLASETRDNPSGSTRGAGQLAFVQSVPCGPATGSRITVRAPRCWRARSNKAAWNKNGRGQLRPRLFSSCTSIGFSRSSAR